MTAPLADGFCAVKITPDACDIILLLCASKLPGAVITAPYNEVCGETMPSPMGMAVSDHFSVLNFDGLSQP